MKPSRSAKPIETDVGVIRRVGHIVPPPNFATVRRGQRSYFDWNGREIVFASAPKRDARTATF